jgi:hypothetical protein
MAHRSIDASEWLVEKHGTSRRRSWRNLHIGLDVGSGRDSSTAFDRDTERVSRDLSDTAGPTQIAGHGQMGWRKSSDYNICAKVEAAIGRYKRVIGDAFRSGTDKTEATEVAIAAAALKRTLGRGRPNHVRIE